MGFDIINEKPDLSLDREAFYERYGRNKLLSIHTLGCKVNDFESDALSGLFVKDGYETVGADEFADVYIINTCTVTNIGDRKSRQFIRRARKINGSAIVVAMGCYSQVAPTEVMNVEGVNIVMGTDDRSRLVEMVKDVMPTDKVCTVGDIMEVKDFEELSIDGTIDKTRAYIKIQEGCNMYCSYCIIPYARGNIRSRDSENVILEVKRLVKAGFKEFVMTGIHIASYGKEKGNAEKTSLIELLEELDKVEGLERIRLSSLEPRLMSEEFVRRIAKLRTFCGHFHLSLQSGSSSVLKRMNRKYDADEYFEVVKRIRGHFDNPSFTTDVIVGFPGETDEEFEETLEFVKKVGFHQIHVFKYSPKKGTPAEKMKPQVSPETKQIRSDRLIALSEEMERDYISGFVGKELDILFEDNSTNLFSVRGHSKNYLVVEASGSMSDIGCIKRVLIESVEGNKLIGKAL